MDTHRSFSPEETKQYASRVLDDILKEPQGRQAKVVALEGELGSGKTTFAQGFLRKLESGRRVTSPTFTLIKRYALSHICVYHIDAYRVGDKKELSALGVEDIISNPSYIVLIEWADRVRELVPQGALWIQFRHREKENERIIKVSVI